MKLPFSPVRRLTFSALMLALAFVLPFFTGQIPQIGAMLCPMHLPVLLCGFVCGWPWGLAVGAAAPLLRSLTLGMPPLFPTALCMSFELAAYGAAAGLLMRRLPQRRGSLYAALLLTMVFGRLVWGAVRWLCVGLGADAFGMAAFWAAAVTNALPGIALQLVLIPPLVTLLEQRRCIRN